MEVVIRVVDAAPDQLHHVAMVADPGEQLARIVGWSGLRKVPMRRQATDRPCLSANSRPTARRTP